MTLQHLPNATALRLLVALAGFAPAGCKDDDGDADDAADTTGATTGATSDATADGSDTADDETAGAPAVTYWQDVAPILYDNCMTCHREGGIGTFSLETYDDARVWAPAISAAMQARTMPPWLVTDDGSCGDFRDSRWVDAEAIDLVAAWAADGAPQGEPRDDLAVPSLPGLEGATALQTPQFTPAIVGGPLSEYDEYRCFLVDPDLPADRFLTGYDVEPGNDAIVHHVLVMPVDPNLEVDAGITNADVMAALDGESPDREGWPCFGEAGDGVETSGIPVVWAPGQGVVEFPTGTGLRIGADEQLVVQVHYNLADPDTIGMSDSTTVQLRLEESVEREAYMLLIDPFLDSLFTGMPIELPPGEASVEYTWELRVEDIFGGSGLSQVDLAGVFPHMHEHGRTMHFEIDDAGGTTCAAEVPRWDFDWQLQYFYEQPRTLELADTLRVTCEFDTRGAEEPVQAGWGTHNEMCLMGMYVVP